MAVHNPKINWKMGEVKMMRCLLLCGRVKIKEEERKKRRKRVAILEKEKIVRWVIDDKEDWEKKKLRKTIEKSKR